MIKRNHFNVTLRDGAKNAPPQGERLYLGLLLAILFLALPKMSSAATVEGLPEAHIVGTLKYKDSWNFYVAPHIWIAGVSGHTNDHGTRANFSTPLSKLRSDLDTTFGAELEANKDLWTLVLDSDYVKVTQRVVVKNTLTNSTYESTMTDAGAYYQMYSNHSPMYITRSSVELLAAARVITLHTSIKYIHSGRASVSDTSNLLVPYLGLRLKHSFNPRWHIGFTAGVGGFQVDHVSNTWTAMLGMGYQLNKSVDFNFGYKIYGVNYTIHAVTTNTLLQGPVLGCGFSW